MICRFCGSEALVWDHVLGYVVCSSCGSVVGDIMDDGVAVSRVASARLRAPLRPRGLRSQPVVDRFSLISSVVNARALEALSRYPMVRTVLELVDSNPLLKARTLRGRVALALYATYRALGYSRPKSRVLAARIARVSPRTIERVERRSRRALVELEAKARGLFERLAREKGFPLLPPPSP